MKVIFACISFGHGDKDIEEALSGAVRFALQDRESLVIAVDDCSGRLAFDNPDIRYLSTPSRLGFAGVVNFLLDTYGHSYDRLVLINPDAKIDSENLGILLASTHLVAVPRISEGGYLQNVRYSTSSKEQLRALLFGEGRYGNAQVSFERSSDMVLSCPPFAPSGSVLSIELSALKEVPLRAEYFWLEQSDWAYRYRQVAEAAELHITAAVASHSGASTSVRYPVSVAASQIRSKTNFIKEYGNALEKVLLPLAVLMRSGRFALKTRSILNGVFLARCAAGRVDWRVQR